MTVVVPGYTGPQGPTGSQGPTGYQGAAAPINPSTITTISLEGSTATIASGVPNMNLAYSINGKQMNMVFSLPFARTTQSLFQLNWIIPQSVADLMFAAVKPPIIMLFDNVSEMCILFVNKSTTTSYLTVSRLGSAGSIPTNTLINFPNTPIAMLAN